MPLDPVLSRRFPWVELTASVGREAELADLRSLLGSHRCVLFTGGAGTGKSRLAVALARAVGQNLRVTAVALDNGTLGSGIAWPDLRTVLAPNADESGGEAVRSGRRRLLLLDGAEAAPNSVQWVTALLAEDPDALVLVTSRTRLDVPGGLVWPVQGLSTERPVGRTGLRAESLSDAERLFIARAGLVRPGFAVTHDGEAGIRHLVSSCAGVPLHLETLAGQMHALTPQDLAGSEPPAWWSPEVLAQWSRHWWTLSAAARSVLHLSAVFQDSFTLVDLRDLAELVGTAMASQDVLAGLRELTDQSLVHLRDSGHGSVSYRVDVTARTGVRCEGVDELPPWRELRARWVQGLLAGHSEFWMGAIGQQSSHRLRQHHHDMTAVLDEAVATPRHVGSVSPDAAMGMAAAARIHWMAADRIGEGLERLHALLDRSDVSDQTRADGLAAAAYLHAVRYEAPQAEPLLAECKALADNLGSRQLTMQCAFVTGVLCWGGGDPDAARSALAEVAAQARAAGSTRLLREASFVLGIIAADTAEDPPADLREELARIDEHSGEWGRAYLGWVRAVRATADGEATDARLVLDDTIASLRGQLDLSIVGWCLSLYATLVARDREHVLAARLLGATSTRDTPALGEVLGPLREEAHHACQRALGPRLFSQEFELGMRAGLAGAVDFIVTPVSNGATGGSTPLTRREEQVRSMAARGMANKQIAAELFLSVRTVEGHVQRVLAKLGLTTRTHLAVSSVDSSMGAQAT